MMETKIVEATWTLKPGPLDDLAVARRLLEAVGSVTSVEPSRYDLDRRGRWRSYDGRRLLVDMVTQRTQLVIIEEKRDLENGGVVVVVATGKQGRPPQVAARWLQIWPPADEEIDKWCRAVQDAFASLELGSFQMSVDGDAVLRAQQPDRSSWIENWTK